MAGTVLNYLLDHGLNKATILFPGVACFALAVVMGALTHVFNEEHLAKRKRRFDDSAHGHVIGNTTVGFEHGSGTQHTTTQLSFCVRTGTLYVHSMCPCAPLGTRHLISSAVAGTGVIVISPSSSIWNKDFYAEHL